MHTSYLSHFTTNGKPGWQAIHNEQPLGPVRSTAEEARVDARRSHVKLGEYVWMGDTGQFRHWPDAGAMRPVPYVVSRAGDRFEAHHAETGRLCAVNNTMEGLIERMDMLTEPRPE